MCRAAYSRGEMVYRKALRRIGSGPAEEPVVNATAFPPGDGGAGDGDAIEAEEVDVVAALMS